MCVYALLRFPSPRILFDMLYTRTLGALFSREALLDRAWVDGMDVDGRSWFTLTRKVGGCWSEVGTSCLPCENA